MGRSAVFAGITILALASAAGAQHSAPWELLEPGVRLQGEVVAAGESVICTLPFPPSASIFDCDKILGTSPLEFIGNEMLPPHTTWRFDETCSMISSWTTAVPSNTITGLAFDEQTGSTYWVVEPFIKKSILEYAIGTGVPTGMSVPLATGTIGVWGGLAIDTHLPGKLAYCEDIASDVVVEYDLVSGAVGMSFPNPDNLGAGAYGNDVGDAADPAACLGATLILASGLLSEQQVSRVSQIDKFGTLCYETWELRDSLASYGETFVDGIEEFVSAVVGDNRLLCMGAVTNHAYILHGAYTARCNGIDAPASDVLYVNGSQGDASQSISIDPTIPVPIGAVLQRPLAAGNGQFVVHLNAGVPTAATITTLPASLGRICHPLLLPPAGTAAPVAVWNNLGRPTVIGASNYFGLPIPNPAPAPTFFWTLAAGDPLNLPYGSAWTIQGVVRNPASTSPKGASVTNAIVLLAY